MLFVGDGQSSCHPVTDTKDIVKEVLQQLEYAKTQASVKTGAMPVIFTPEGVANALRLPLMVGFNGKLVLEGSSPMGNKLNQKVFDAKLSVYDNPTINFCPASRPCDDEGIPSRKTPLIENGVATAFLYDLQTAALAGTASTGSASRQGGIPSPSTSALVFSPGDVTFKDMVADIKEGLVVEYLMGAGQGNVLGGDFSGNVLLGYKIENGKIIGRVKDTMVSGNVYQALKRISAVGSESRWIGGSVYTPPIYLQEVSVAGK
jgi:PmbA protein